MKTISTRAFLGLALLALASGAHAADGERKVDQRRSLTATGEVRVSNVAGSIKLVGWNRNEVQVTGTLGDDVERLEFDGRDDYAEIRVILPRRGCRNCDGSADLTINVPTRARVEVDAVSADIDARGTEGAVRLNSVSGTIVIASKSVDLSLKSVSGDVTVDGSGPKARVEARTVSGDLAVRGVDGELEAGSVSGDVEVRDSQLRRLGLESTSGGVRYTGPLLAGGSYEFQSVSGGVELGVQGARDATFDVSSFSGDIDNAFGPKPRRTSEYGPGRELRFTEGKGAARVRMNTLSGEIVIR
jgi:DUF4097 and DUF4098 domain-containing protein YvlB